MSQIKVPVNGDKLLKSILESVLNVLEERKHVPHVFIGLSGGSIIKLLTDILAQLDVAYLGKLRFYFCDERLVPLSDPESTFGLYWQAIVKSQLPITAEQFVKVNEQLDPSAAATDYETRILGTVPSVSDNNVPTFDILFLGMGPDGHTASLFPGHVLLNECDKLIAPIEDSPKPPPKRVTFTYKLINNARNVFFVALGKGKQQVIKEIFIEGKDYPSSRVKAKNVVWYLDKESSALLPEQFVI